MDNSVKGAAKRLLFSLAVVASLGGCAVYDTGYAGYGGYGSYAGVSSYDYYGGSVYPAAPPARSIQGRHMSRRLFCNSTTARAAATGTTTVTDGAAATTVSITAGTGGRAAVFAVVAVLAGIDLNGCA